MPISWQGMKLRNRSFISLCIFKDSIVIHTVFVHRFLKFTAPLYRFSYSSLSVEFKAMIPQKRGRSNSSSTSVTQEVKRTPTRNHNSAHDSSDLPAMSS